MGFISVKKHIYPFTLPYNLSLSWGEINKGLYEGLEGFTANAEVSVDSPKVVHD